ncbi:MAG: copper resistance protein [Archangium gephyra]|uniref:Copper resistance protein n=1 Tax=Archangium gephyra TaxID=48 RepID=A0A2W5T2S4_9BACT|nr:MAG: copper resistance protein [Archangium gephyra]
MEPLLTSMGIASAFLAGLTGSLHCALMCGPLACVALPKTQRVRAGVAWHVGRVAAYATLGLLLGALGRSTLLILRVDVSPVLPWVMATGLVLTALEVSKRIPAIPGVVNIARVFTRWSHSVDPTSRAVLLGAATPFLPCGLLYGMFLAALSTGSAPGGAGVLAAFALGGVPALAAAQFGARRLEAHPVLLKRVVPLVAATVLIARALALRNDVAPCG